MQFNENHLVILNTMNEAEARAFILFLESEKERHLDDVTSIIIRIAEVRRRFDV